ncbi:MAG: alkaline phosphatase [Gammaproteobacteria bacterium]
MTKTSLIMLFLCLVLSGHSVVADTGYAQSHRYPLTKVDSLNNVILMIGDGMGMSHITSARLHAKGVDGFLEIDRLPVTGLVKTYSKDHFITDSAAAGTALATGYKTNNGVISRTSAGKPLYTLLEAARDHDMATAIVVTSSITHATPAVFAAHNMDRRNEAEIAVDMLQNNIDVLLGGGKAFFIPADNQGSKRTDGLDLIRQAQQQGYTFIETRDDLLATDARKLLGLFQLGALTTVNPEPSLAEITGKAIQVLKQKDRGFFMVVEGSQIDWGGHGNNVEKTIRQILLFDQAIAVAMEFAIEDQHTLVIVTADHETGGMAITYNKEDNKAAIEWGTKHHTAVDVPLFAYGPHATGFTGVMDNTEIPRIIGNYLGLKNFPAIVNKESN